MLSADYIGNSQDSRIIKMSKKFELALQERRSTDSK